MARYIFQVQYGAEGQPDTYGVELPNLVVVREEAVNLAAALLREMRPSFWEGDDWTLTVQDDDGLTLLSVMVTATEAPALKRITPTPATPVNLPFPKLR